MDRTSIYCFALLLALGCSADAQTPGGTTDGGLTIDRTKVYCRTATMPADPAVSGVAVSCDKDGDIPLHGGCSLSSAAGTVYGLPGQPSLTLITNSGGNWEVKPTNPPGPAGWACSWATSASGQVNVPGATASICCLAQ